MNRATTIALVVVVSAVVAGLEWRDSPNDALVTGTLMLVVGVAFGLWTSRRGPHVTLEAAQARSGERGGYVLWKPGCVYCERLIARMRGDDRVHWVNVKQDEAANAEVRSLNEGNEYTPTAVVGGLVLRNPSADQLRKALDARG